MAAGARVRFDGVGHEYQISGQRLNVLQDVSFSVLAGETLAILGPSGSGKSTLLKMMMGSLSPHRGAVELSGADGRQTKLSVVFQEPTLMPWLTTAENVRLPLDLEGRLEGADAKVAEALERVGLRGFGEYKPSQLSGGMQSRAALARALITEPELLLLDEPFANLDEVTSEDVVVDLTRLTEASRSSVVLITHSLFQAAYMADRVVVLSARPGRVLGEFKIDAPRPRSRAFLESAEFADVVAQLRGALREATRAAA